MRDYDIRLQLGSLHDRITEYIQGVIDRNVTYIDSQTHRADVVGTLPPNAPAGYLLVTPGDPNLYVGTGPTTPLRKLPTQLL